MKILLGDLNVKVGKEVTLKPNTANDSLYEISNDNGFKVVSFATKKTHSQDYDVPTSQHP
jgi:hypothetical protein